MPEDAVYQRAKRNLVETSVFFSHKENQKTTTAELQSRFASTKTVSGTQRYHSFMPSPDLTLTLRNYPLSSQFDVFPKKTVRQSRKYI